MGLNWNPPDLSVGRINESKEKLIAYANSLRESLMKMGGTTSGIKLYEIDVYNALVDKCKKDYDMDLEKIDREEGFKGKE